VHPARQNDRRAGTTLSIYFKNFFLRLSTNIYPHDKVLWTNTTNRLTVDKSQTLAAKLFTKKNELFWL